MDTLSEPISAEAPCGVDLSYDPIYNDLAVQVQGTPENQFEPNSAKEPNWGNIRQLAEEGLKRSKDLQIAVYYAVALTQTDGIAGAARGLELIAEITRQYWPALFPNLDPEDKDPTQRVNILAQLTVEAGSYGDPIKFIERFNSTAIFNTPGLGGVSVTLLTKAGGPGVEQLPQMVATAVPAEVTAGVDAFRRVLASVHAVDDFLITTVGREKAPSFDPLIKALDKGLQLFEGVATAGGAAGAVGVEAGAAGPVKAAISGEIQSEDDVRRVLQKICDFYAVHEKSSPVPLLLRRAIKLIGLDFQGLLDNLTSTGRSAIDPIVGPKDPA